MSICLNDITECRIDNHILKQKDYFHKKYGKYGERMWKEANRRFFFIYNFPEKTSLQMIRDSINDTIQRNININIDTGIDVHIKNSDIKFSEFLIEDIHSIIIDYIKDDFFGLTFFSCIKKEQIVRIDFSINTTNYEDEYDIIGIKKNYRLCLHVPIYLLCRFLLHNPDKIDYLLMFNNIVNIDHMNIGFYLYNRLVPQNTMFRS
jgi:hypothetical protein